MTRSNDEVVLAAALREDFYTFFQKAFSTLHPGIPLQDNWHLRVMAYELQAVALGRTQRLIVNLPPRSLKSIAASVALVAWYLGHHPAHDVICASYGQDLAIRFAHDCRRVMQSRWYQAVFPTRIHTAKSAAADFRTTAGGGRLATSVLGPMTGRGADLIVIDDPAKPEEMLSDVQREAVNRWMASTVYSRLNHQETSGIIVAMQRLHVADLTGVLSNDPAWKILRLAAIAERDEQYVIQTIAGTTRTFERKEGEVLHPARQSRATLDRIRETLGSYFFAAQYQQTPMAIGGNLVKWEWFARYTEPPAPFERVIQSWDTASKPGELNSYSVCTTWGVRDKHVYLLHVFRKRLEYPDLKRAVKEQADLFKPTVILVEEKSSGAALLQELKREQLYTLKEVNPTGSKVMRLSAQTAFIENGFVHLPEQAPWLSAYENELMLFPASEHSDQVDSTSQALAYIQEQLQEPGMIGFYRWWLKDMGIEVPGFTD